MMESQEDRSLTSTSLREMDLPDFKVLPEHGVRRMGYLRKLKTMKKKFFVLREASAEKPACLEYFDAQKKFDCGHSAKRCVQVAGSFAVNKKEDCEQKNAISIFTDKETFSIVANSEREQGEWLKDLVDLRQTALQEGSPSTPNDLPLFEYVWNVDIQKKDLGLTKGITGLHRMCLFKRMLKLYPLNSPPDAETLSGSISLARVRKVGHTKKYFFIEVGKGTKTGAGEFCLEAEDMFSAQHMHNVINEELRKGGEEGQRSRCHTNQETSRPRQRSDGSDMEARALSDLTPVSGSGSRERLKSAEQRIPEYAIPDFQHSTSVEDNYLPIDMDQAYYPCDYQTKPDPQLNYSAINSKTTDSPRKISPGMPTLAETPRSQLSPSIPEEHGDYIPVTMPSHQRVTPASVSIQNVSNSSEESGYFEMNLPGKPEAPKALPPTATAHERLPSVPEATSNPYMMMTPIAANAGSGSSGVMTSDSRRSTMSNASHHSFPSDRGEHNDTVASEITYAVMEPIGVVRSRRENSSREASTSSLGSSFGWDRLSSFGSRADYKLEKVRAFMAIDDAQDPKLRENRAYSTGCNPSKATSFFKRDLPSVTHASEAFRIRAYSLGNHAASPTTSRSGRQRGILHPPSAATELGSLPSPSDSQNVQGEIRLISVSDNQLTPNGSGGSTPLRDVKKSEAGSRAEDLMEMTFRPRLGT